MTISLIDTHLRQIFGGISTLTENHPVHALPLLVLVYSAIDQLSWLVSEKEKHGPDDFKHWVNKYIKPEETLNCNAGQMWAARNGILHMGTAESSNTRAGVEKICYFVGKTQTSTRSGYIFISMDKFIERFLTVAMEFAEELKVSEHQDLAEQKLQKVLLLCSAESPQA